LTSRRRKTSPARKLQEAIRSGDRTPGQLHQVRGRPQCGEQLPNGLPLARQDQVWRKFGQRTEHEVAQVGARVRQGQGGGLSHLATPRDKIEIKGARFVENYFGAPPELTLDALELGQQQLWGQVRPWLKNRHRIHKVRGAGRAVDRDAAPE